MPDFHSKHLLCDKDVARLLSMSPSWVRQQRHLRRSGQPHALTIDPLYVGSSPRYRADEVCSWIEELGEGSGDA